MLKDSLPKVSGCTGPRGKICGSFSAADNSLTCDSEGNCMLKD